MSDFAFQVITRHANPWILPLQVASRPTSIDLYGTVITPTLFTPVIANAEV